MISDWTEVAETFDSMGLHENLLRGIYAYGPSSDAATMKFLLFIQRLQPSLLPPWPNGLILHFSRQQDLRSRLRSSSAESSPFAVVTMLYSRRSLARERLPLSALAFFTRCG